MRWLLLAACLFVAGCAQPASLPDAPSLACVACAVAIADGHPYFWEPFIAVDPKDPQHVVAAVALLRRDPATAGADLFGDDMLVAFSRDGGATWSQQLIPHGDAVPPGHPLFSARNLADPNVAFLPDGTTIVSGLGYSAVGAPGVGAFGQGFRIWVARFGDEGQSPEITVAIEAPGVASFGAAGNRGLLADSPDAPTIAVTPDGALHLAFRRMVQPTPADPERSVMTSMRSDDGGRTWSEPVTVIEGRNAVAALLVPHDGAVLAAVGGWGSGGLQEEMEGYQIVARTEDGGATWDHVEIDDEHLPTLAWWPTLGVSDAGVHVAYAADGPGGRERLMLANSTDGGATFGPAVEVARAAAPGAMLPIFGSDERRAVLTWFEPQADGTNRLMGRSMDARGMSPPIVLDATLREDATILGEYFGVTVHGDDAWAVWTSNAPEGQLRLAGLRLA